MKNPSILRKKKRIRRKQRTKLRKCRVYSSTTPSP